jgi:hypothetical protein
LGKLKIRCIYNKNGCKEILFLDNLKDHEKICSFYKKICRFDKKICDKCFCQESVNHNCFKSLLESKQKSEERIEELQKELIISTNKLAVMNSEIENYLQTIQELTYDSGAIQLPCHSKEVNY